MNDPMTQKHINEAIVDDDCQSDDMVMINAHQACVRDVYE